MSEIANHGNGPGILQDDLSANPMTAISPAEKQDNGKNEDKDTKMTSTGVSDESVSVITTENGPKTVQTTVPEPSENGTTQPSEGADSEVNGLPDIDSEPELCIAEEMDTEQSSASSNKTDVVGDTQKPEPSKEPTLKTQSDSQSMNDGNQEENKKSSSVERKNNESSSHGEDKQNENTSHDELKNNEKSSDDQHEKNEACSSEEQVHDKPKINMDLPNETDIPGENIVKHGTEQGNSNIDKEPNSINNEVQDKQDIKQDQTPDKSVTLDGNKEQGGAKPGDGDGVTAEKPGMPNRTSESRPPLVNSAVAKTTPFDWSSIGVHRCPTCKFTTDDIQLHSNHVTSCSSPKFNQGEVRLSSSIGIPMSYSCDTCVLSWLSKAEFEEHVVCHIIDNPYLCITCKRSFFSRFAIEKHAKSDHPNGDSRCALRGMKKCREYVKSVELAGKYSFQGKLNIPKTPRNQIRDAESSTEGAAPGLPVSNNTPAITNSGIPNSTPVTEVQVNLDKKKQEGMEIEEAGGIAEETAATMPSPRPNISKFMNTSITSTETNKQVKQVADIIKVSTAPTLAVSNELLNRGAALRYTVDHFPSAPATSSQENNPGSLFQVMANQNDTFQPLPLPSKIQKMVNVANDNTGKKARDPPPPYHVKHITEFTKASPVKTTSSVVTPISSTPVWLIPFGQPRPLSQPGVQSSQNVRQATQVYRPTGNIGQAPIVLNAPHPNQYVILRPETTMNPLNNQSTITVSSSFVTMGKATPPRMMTPNTQQTKLTTSSWGPRIHRPAAPTSVLHSPPSVKSTPVLTQTAITQSQIMTARSPLTSFINSASPPGTSTLSGFVTVPASGNSDPSAEKKLQDKTYTFRIKPQKGFVCESCRKYTRDELVFRKHVWEHFHMGSTACKYCKNEEKIDNVKTGVLNCLLVNEIVCKLVKNTVKQKDANETIVIDITGEDDDEEVKANKDENRKDTENKAIEVIIVDDDDESEKDSLNIKITSTYSLSDVGALENMSKETPEKPAKTMESSKETDNNEATGNGTDNEKDVSMSSLSMDTSFPAGNSDEDETNIPALDDDCRDDTDDDTVTDEKELVKTLLTQPLENIDKFVSESIDKIFAVPSLGKTFVEDTDETCCSLANETGETMDLNEKTNEGGSNSKSAPVLRSRSRSSTPTVLSNKDMFESEIISTHGHNAFYMCGYEQCSFSCLTSQGYKEHLQSKHLNELNNFVCCHCGRKDYNDESHVRHMYSHASASTKTFYLHKCPLRQCKYKTNMPQMYKEHVTKHDEPVIKCSYCNKIFPTVDDLLKHHYQNLLKFVSCPYCPFRIVQKEVVVKHIQLFHSDKPRMVTVTSQIVCQDREINFYVEPLAKKSGNKDVSKDTPNADLMSITALLDEVEKSNEQTPRTGHDEMEVDVVSVLEANTAKKLDETAPPVILPEATALTSRVPLKPQNKSAAAPKSLKCPKCSFLSHNMSFHIQHISLHENEPEREKRFVCNLCPKGIENINQFKKHVSNHIGKHEIKVFSCTTCSYSSNQKCHIMDHCADNHNGKGMYVQTIETVISSEASCKYCDFKARQPETVMQHEEVVHRVSASGNTEESDQPPALEKESEVETSKKQKYHCDYCTPTSFFKHKIDLKGHLENEHLDIEEKQFAIHKCKYCSRTSTIKDLIIAHMGKAHPGKIIRILRKVEQVKSVKKSMPEEEKQQKHDSVNQEQTENLDIVKEKIGIPDGNAFKHPFQCPKCSFSSNLRITVMRHIKTHPELTPVRELLLSSEKKTTKTTARKSTGPSQQDFPARKHSALYQDIPSSQLHNPFSSLKNDNSEIELYALGENDLHTKLSACFIPLEKDVLFQCRICSCKIAKKFVVHRHILDHLGIVFFKCRYCTEGTIEKSLMFGHIQKEHPQKSLSYIKVSKPELDNQIKDKIFGQDFNDAVIIESAANRSVSPLDNTGIITKAVDETVQPASTPVNKSKFNCKSFECPHCSYKSIRKKVMTRHISYHSDPARNIVCLDCDFRGMRIHVLKHCYSLHGRAKIRTDTESTSFSRPEISNKHQEENKEPKTDKQEAASMTAVGADTDSQNSEKTESPALRSSSVDKKGLSDETSGKETKEKNYFIKTVYKCKECGLNREAMSSMYNHFKSDKKCNRPVYKCSLCCFKSALKTDVKKHGKIHAGKKPAIEVQPLREKIKTLKIPVKFKSNGSKSASEERSLVLSASSRASSITRVEDAGVRCKLCKYHTDTVMALQFHINTKHGGKLLHCQECPYKTPLVKHMINHCTNVHRQTDAMYKQAPKGVSGKASTPDDDSSSIASSSLAGNEDSQTSTSGKQLLCCTKCDYASESHLNLRRHLFTHFKYRPYQCKYCDTSRTERSALMKHFRKLHPNKPMFTYKLSKNEATENKIDKLVQLAQYRKKKVDMSTGASRPSRLDKFKLMEEGLRTDGTDFFCDFCGLKSVSKSNIIRHYKTSHATSFTPTKKRALEVDEKEKSFSPRKKVPKKEPGTSLDMCSSESEGEEEENEEKKSVLYSVVVDKDGKKRFKCPKCSYKGETKSRVYQHMKIHGARLFQCCYCNFTTKLVWNAYRHVANIHEGEEVKALNKNTNQIHRKGTSPARVVTSPARSTSSPARSKAEVTVKKEPPPVRPKKDSQVLEYCCNVCPYKVKGMYQFRRHLASHPDKFTYIVEAIDSKMACGYCSYIAVHEIDFSVHIASHLGERRFKCGRCDYTTFIRNLIVKHSRHMHPDSPVDVVDRDKRKDVVLRMLVNLDPKVCVKRVDVPKRKSKKFKRIKVMSRHSSDESLSESKTGDKLLSDEEDAAVENVQHEVENDKNADERNSFSTDVDKMETEINESVQTESAVEANHAFSKSTKQDNEMDKTVNYSRREETVESDMEDEMKEKTLPEKMKINEDSGENELTEANAETNLSKDTKEDMLSVIGERTLTEKTENEKTDTCTETDSPKETEENSLSPKVVNTLTENEKTETSTETHLVNDTMENRLISKGDITLTEKTENNKETFTETKLSNDSEESKLGTKEENILTEKAENEKAVSVTETNSSKETEEDKLSLEGENTLTESPNSSQLEIMKTSVLGFETVTKGELENVDQPAAKVSNDNVDKASIPIQTSISTDRKTALNSVDVQNGSDNSEICKDTTCIVYSTGAETVSSEGAKSLSLGESYDLETKTNANSESENMPGNLQDNQEIESLHERTLSRLESQGFEISTQNVNVSHSSPLLDQDSANSDNKSVEEMDVSNSSEQVLSPKEPETTRMADPSISEPTSKATEAMSEEIAVPNESEQHSTCFKIPLIVKETGEEKNVVEKSEEVGLSNDSEEANAVKTNTEEIEHSNKPEEMETSEAALPHNEVTVDEPQESQATKVDTGCETVASDSIPAKEDKSIAEGEEMDID